MILSLILKELVLLDILTAQPYVTIYECHLIDDNVPSDYVIYATLTFVNLMKLRDFKRKFSGIFIMSPSVQGIQYVLPEDSEIPM
jgi:hypothetical protein